MHEMIYKPNKCKVLVADFFKENHLMAVIYDPNVAGKNKGGGGWGIVRAKNLIPVEYWSETSGFQSKSYRNRIKARLQIKSIELECTDGEVFDSYAKAVEHESEIYEAEKREVEAMEGAARPEYVIGVDLSKTLQRE